MTSLWKLNSILPYFGLDDKGFAEVLSITGAFVAGGSCLAAFLGAPIQEGQDMDIWLPTGKQFSKEHPADWRVLWPFRIYLESKGYHKETSQEKWERLHQGSSSIFDIPMKLSDELCTFLGKPHGSKMSCADVTKQLNNYIQHNHLYNPRNIHDIEPDAALRTLLQVPETDKLEFSNLKRYLSKHLLRAEGEIEYTSMEPFKTTIHRIHNFYKTNEKGRETKIQVIECGYVTPQDILKYFDLNICQFYTDDIHWNHGYPTISISHPDLGTNPKRLLEIHGRIMRPVANSTYLEGSKNTLARIAKYKARGFRLETDDKKEYI